MKKTPLKNIFRGVGIVARRASVIPVLVYFFAAPAFGIEPWESRKVRFEQAAEKGMEVVDAIERFQADHGLPPDSLEALVPAYLPQKPATGLPDYPDYGYRVFADPGKSAVWYDLGSREGKPMSSKWPRRQIYLAGDPEHAILLFFIDGNNQVVKTRFDRMPAEFTPADFDPVRWAAGLGRIEMAPAIPRLLSLPAAQLPEIEEVLGKPDGDRAPRKIPWELRIDCSRGFLNWDVFFYWPGRDYPGFVYGGVTVPIGEWCYVHE